MLELLTKGALDKILKKGINVDKPTVQLLDYVKLVDPSNEKWRYRLIISDGCSASSLVVLRSNLKDIITFNAMTKNSVIQIKHYTLMKFKDGRNERFIMWINKVKVLKPSGDIGCNLSILGKVDLNKVKQEEITTLISDLRDDLGRWFIKAQVVNKFLFHNEGDRYCSFVLTDKSGKIKCTAYKSQCDKLFDLLEVGQYYYIFQGFLTSVTSGSDYEMIVTKESQILKCNDKNHEIVTFQYEFNLKERTYKLIKPETKNTLISGLIKLPLLLLIIFLILLVFCIFMLVIWKL